MMRSEVTRRGLRLLTKQMYCPSTSQMYRPFETLRTVQEIGLVAQNAKILSKLEAMASFTAMNTVVSSYLIVITTK